MRATPLAERAACKLDQERFAALDHGSAHQEEQRDKNEHDRGEDVYRWPFVWRRWLTADDSAKWTGKEIGVTDGDTIDFLTVQNQVIRVRFNGIDTPERGQPFGNNAKQFVSDAVFSKPVTIVGHETDR